MATTKRQIDPYAVDTHWFYACFLPGFDVDVPFTGILTGRRQRAMMDELYYTVMSARRGNLVADRSSDITEMFGALRRRMKPSEFDDFMDHARTRFGNDPRELELHVRSAVRSRLIEMPDLTVPIFIADATSTVRTLPKGEMD